MFKLNTVHLVALQYVIVVFPDHTNLLFQFMVQIEQPAKCIDKEGKMTSKLTIGKTCLFHRPYVSKLNNYFLIILTYYF